VWVYVVSGAALLIMAAGVVAGVRWMRYAIYLAAVVLIFEWFWYVWLALPDDYFSNTSFFEGVLSLVPSLGVLALALYCCFVARKYMGGGRSPTR